MHFIPSLPHLLVYISTFPTFTTISAVSVPLSLLPEAQVGSTNRLLPAKASGLSLLRQGGLSLPISSIQRRKRVAKMRQRAQGGKGWEAERSP